MGAGASDRCAEPPCDYSSRQLLADTDTGKQQRDHAVFQHFGNFSVSECYPAHFHSITDCVALFFERREESHHNR